MSQEEQPYLSLGLLVASATWPSPARQEQGRAVGGSVHRDGAHVAREPNEAEREAAQICFMVPRYTKEVPKG